ncbi:MAG: hypothetical protein HY248_01180, partial [Fimbriimonas ginsengisoli]|nr:hypothetical protein [Fimbriimonas ginsengisoli]
LPSPSVLGDPHTAAPQEFALPSAYWPIVIKPGANLAESAVTLGPLVLALMFLLPWRDRRSWPVIALALISILLALGTPLNRLLYFGLPGWSSTGSPARVLALFVMSACVLAGFALSHVFATRAGKGGRSQILPLLPAILAVVSVLLERTAPVPERLRVGVDQLIVAAHSTAVPGLVITSAIGGVLLLLARRGPSRQALVFAIIAPALLAGFFVFALVPTGQPLAQVAGPPDLARIAVFNERWSLYRTPAALLPPNTASLSHIHELGGYDSLLNRNTVAELRQIDGRDPAPPENGNMMLIKPGATVQGLASAGVTETWALGLNGIERRPVAGPGRVACPAGDAKIIEEGADRLRVSASGPGNLVIKDNLAGCDWVGTLDGQTVLLRDGSRVEIALPPGRHELALKSRWPGWLAACWSLGLALLLVALAAKPGTPEPERPDTMSSELDNEPNRSRT